MAKAKKKPAPKPKAPRATKAAAVAQDTLGALLELGARVLIQRAGSWAFGRMGTVQGIDGGAAQVRIDGKGITHAFAATDLRVA